MSDGWNRQFTAAVRKHNSVRASIFVGLDVEVVEEGCVRDVVDVVVSKACCGLVNFQTRQTHRVFGFTVNPAVGNSSCTACDPTFTIRYGNSRL